MTSTLNDRFGRVAEKLRISVTDRCNFRCQYCMPEEGMQWLQRDALLSFEEMTRLVTIFAELGITQIRLTGGEPLLRKNLSELVRQLAPIPGIQKIAITTNGYALEEQGQALYDAGIRSFNVSLDSLNSARFAQITRRNFYRKVMQGLASLEKLPECEIKLNVVLMRGINDDEAEDFARLAHEKPYTVRFIEFMPIGGDDNWDHSQVVTGQEVIARIQKHYTLEPVEAAGKNPAARWRFSDGAGELGFIDSVSQPFCHSCNRVRLTADGQLRTCLFSTQETNLKDSLRAGMPHNELVTLIQQAIWQKEPGHLINRPGFEKPLRTMSAIGG